LPDEMAVAAGIKDEAVLVGMIDRFEIWNRRAMNKWSHGHGAFAQGFRNDGVINL